MRVRDHVVLSTVSAALLFPWLREAVLRPWAASIFIDADHYLWFCLSQRRLNPVAAMRLFNQARPPQHKATRLLHNPAVLPLLLLTARFRGVGLGMALHVALDAYHEERTRNARSAALQRDRFTCQSCGMQGPSIVAHLCHQPWLLPSYRTEYFTSLCRLCHETAHAGPASGAALSWQVETDLGLEA